MGKISVLDYVNNNDLLEIRYIPFETKLRIIDSIITEIIEKEKTINTSLIRRISIQIFIENSTNIDLSSTDDNNLDGFNQLYYYNALESLTRFIGNEYSEFLLILKERISDYRANILHLKNDVK